MDFLGKTLAWIIIIIFSFIVLGMCTLAIAHPSECGTEKYYDYVKEKQMVRKRCRHASHSSDCWVGSPRFASYTSKSQ